MNIYLLAYIILSLMMAILGVKVHLLNYYKRSQWYRLLGTFIVNLIAWPAIIATIIIVVAYGYLTKQYKQYKQYKNFKPSKKNV